MLHQVRLFARSIVVVVKTFLSINGYSVAVEITVHMKMWTNTRSSSSVLCRVSRSVVTPLFVFLIPLWLNLWRGRDWLFPWRVVEAESDNRRAPFRIRYTFNSESFTEYNTSLSITKLVSAPTELYALQWMVVFPFHICARHSFARLCDQTVVIWPAVSSQLT